MPAVKLPFTLSYTCSSKTDFLDKLIKSYSQIRASFEPDELGFNN